MVENIPAPVPVAELIAQRRPGRRHAVDGHLDYSEVVAAWPIVGYIGAVVSANQVRTKTASATGTYGTTNWTEYHAGDVQRVADAIADGTAVLRPEWRKDTEEGRDARRRWHEQQHRQLVRAWILSAIVIGPLLAVMWFLVAYA